MIKVNKIANLDELLELLQKAETEGEIIIIEREGKRKIAIIDGRDLEYLESLEDARDSELLRQAVEESQGHTPISFQELLDEHGLTIEDIMTSKGNKD